MIERVLRTNNNVVLLRNKRFLICIKMSKREPDSTLEEFLVGYFKKRKYHMTSELFEKTLNPGVHCTLSPRCENFEKYLKRNIAKLEKEKFVDDLDFEINFDAYQHHTKVRFKNFKLKLFWSS